MGAGKNKSHRKKRISKHVLQAEERRKIAEVEKQLIDGATATTEKSGTAATVDANASSSPKTNASNVSGHPSSSSSPSSSPSSSAAAGGAVKSTKNPQVASTYLSLWKYDRTNNNNNTNNKQWKFNKNTQSWLLRHMYNPIKVPKHSFAILVEYLLNGENVGVKNRVLEDAKFRARRYKEFEKQQSQLQEKGEAEKMEGKEQNTKDDTNKEEAGEQSSSSSPKKVTVVDVSWDKMDEHEKRKEYKRARKVLDAFKEAALVGDGLGESD